MAGIETFPTIADALRAGYQVYEKTDDGYVVRRLGANGWEKAHVVFNASK